MKSYNKEKIYRDVNTGECFTAKQITDASYRFHKRWGSLDYWKNGRKSFSIEYPGDLTFVNPSTNTVSKFSTEGGASIKSTTTPQTFNSNKNSNSNSMKQFNLEMGPVNDDSFKLTIMGSIAVKTKDGYSSYDVEAKTLTDVTGFTLDFNGAFYKMPATSLEKGDLISTEFGYGYVKKAKGDSDSVKIMLLNGGEVKEIVPTVSPFGFSFYTKIVSIFDMGNGGEGTANLFGSEINPMMLMMMSGNGNGFGGGNNDMMNMLVMSQLFSGGGANGLFNFGKKATKAAE